MGRTGTIIETVVRSNGMSPRPQTLHGTEHHQPFTAPSSSSGTFQPVKYNTKFPIKSAARDTASCSDQVLFTEHASPALPSADALHDADDDDTTTSFPQGNFIPRVICGHVTGANLNEGTRIDSSDSVEPISPPSSEASALTERPPPVADVQIDDDPIYSIGKIKVFHKMQKVIEPPYEARWEIVYPDIFDRVLSKLRRRRLGMRSNKLRAIPNIELMSAGTTIDTSVPAVVVVVSKHVKMMQDFLNTDNAVQHLCKPRDGTTVELQVLACKDHLTLIGMPGEHLRIDTVPSSDSDTDFPSDDQASTISMDERRRKAVETRHPGLDTGALSVVFEKGNGYDNVKFGMGIRLVTKDGSRSVRGTCGGLLQLETPNHSSQQVGLVAGHLLEQLMEMPRVWSPAAYETNSVIGDILYPKSSREIPRHDWALFDAAKLDFKSAMATEPKLTIAQKSELPTENTLVKIRTSRGEVTGTLSSSTSGIMLNPDQGFLHVRMIIIDRGSTITKGDSGAWVVQENFGKILGHIIAINSSGHAYMAPMHLTIAEMKAALSVSDVSVAISPDCSFQQSNVQQPGFPHPVFQQRRVMAHHDEHHVRTRRPVTMSEKGEEPNIPAVPIDVGKTNELAETYLNLGYVARGIPLLENIVSNQEQLPQIDRNRLATKHELGRAYSNNGQFLKAIEVFQELTKIRRGFLDQYHPDLVASQHELAFAYTQSGQAPEAIRLLKHVVDVEETIVHKAHVGHLTSRHELARAYLADGQAPEAIKLLEYVVAVRKDTLQESDMHLIESEIVLAEALLKAGRTADGVNLLQQVVAVADVSFSVHPRVRADARSWLRFARRQLYDSLYTRISVQGPVSRSTPPRPRTAAFSGPLGHSWGVEGEQKGPHLDRRKISVKKLRR